MLTVGEIKNPNSQNPPSEPSSNVFFWRKSIDTFSDIYTDAYLHHLILIKFYFEHSISYPMLAILISDE